MSNAAATRFGHPVVDTDSHTVEYLPLALDSLREVAGMQIHDAFLARVRDGLHGNDGASERAGNPRGWYGLTKQERADRRVSRTAFWETPSAHTADLAASMLPGLFRERLERAGIDFAIVYPSLGLRLLHESTSNELRVAGCRAFNEMYARLYGPHAERMTVPALIPAGTPQEALDELEHAVVSLGAKAVVISAPVRRPIQDVARRNPAYAPFATWMDTLALDSPYDYDPLWRRCVDLGVAVAVHAGGLGFAYRMSPDNFAYNHVGQHAAASEAFCKALIMGGVVQRFPRLQVAFLEGGVTWACNLYNDLIEHWEIRNMKAMRELLDPAKVDRGGLLALFRQHGEGRFAGSGNAIPQVTQSRDEDPDDLDDFRSLKIANPEDFAGIFQRFYFGCGAHDRLASIAFDSRLNHFGLQLHAMLGSHFGTFDGVPVESMMQEATKLVEDGLISQSALRNYTFGNAIQLYAGSNPQFFRGTAIEAAVAGELKEVAR